ncbi:MAG: ATP-dependent sacrificial sulfur transferase LarE [Candidatus Methanosuratincola sp.]|nr:ATP-dependent sacrificial sulfur transferase LarE [Candidatus Methanosuratincola sp.]
MSCRYDSLDGKLRELEHWFSDKKGAVVAFSGGVDSTLVAAVAAKVLGDRAVAITLTTEFVGNGDVERARRSAREAGIRHEIMELRLPEKVLMNPQDRCYLCKAAMMKEIRSAAERLGMELVVDGTNSDDVRAARPGIKALRELGIRSPLAEVGVSKKEAYELSVMIGLSVEKGSNSCLATRFPFGHRFKREEGMMVEKGEQFLRSKGFRTVRVRVTDLSAKIEVDPAEIGKALDRDLRKEIVEEFKRIGFRSVSLDLEGYRPGSMDYLESDGV